MYEVNSGTCVALGYQRENLVNTVRFDTRAWLVEYPGAQISISYMRPGETGIYPASQVHVVDGVTEWSIDNTVTAFSGIGSCVLRCVVAGKDKRSAKFSTSVEAGHGVVGPPASPEDDYVDAANSVLRKLQAITATATETTEATADFEETETGFVLAIGIPPGKDGEPSTAVVEDLQERVTRLEDSGLPADATSIDGISVNLDGMADGQAIGLVDGELKPVDKGSGTAATINGTAVEGDLTSEDIAVADRSHRHDISDIDGMPEYITADNVIAGTNVTIERNGDNVTISASGGGGTGSDELWKPSVAESGELSWQKSMSTEPPETVNIKGADGVNGLDGKDGTNGSDGKDGLDGKSAYEIAVEQGFQGSKSEWLVSLKGDKGDKGDTGDKGADGSAINPDWNESDTESPAFIQNKPTNATTETSGFMSATDKTKLNGIATGATAITVTDSLTSMSTTAALSAYQGKILNDGKLDKAGGTMTGTLTAANTDVGVSSVRNISAGTSEPDTTNCPVGAVYFKYE